MSAISLLNKAQVLATGVAAMGAMVGAGEIKEAARHHDQVEHSAALAALFAGALAGALIGAAIVFSGGLAVGPLLFAAASGASIGSGLGELVGSFLKRKTGAINLPCASKVYINSRKAARSAGDGGKGGDFVNCSGAPFVPFSSHPQRVIAEGSGNVFIEGLPAARKGDRTSCDSKIAEGSANVYIGGGTRQYAEIESEVPWYVALAFFLLGFVGPGMLRGLLTALKNLPKLLTSPRSLLRPAGARIRQLFSRTVSHPVEVASGRAFTGQTDFELPGRIAVQFTRIYDTSAVDYEGPLGRGWIHPYDIHLWEDDEQGMVILRDQEALLVGFGLIAVGEKAFNPLNKLWLERLEDKAYVVRDQDGLRYKFESVDTPDAAKSVEPGLNGKSEATALRLTGVEDRNGNRIDLFYEGERLISLVDGAGTRLNFSYITLDNGANRSNRAERLAAVNLALDENSSRTARLVNFTYDAEGRLINATDRGLVPWRYAYEDYLLIRETNRNGLSFHFAYEGEGKDARCVHAWGDGGIYESRLEYDRETMTTVVEDSLGRRTTYNFNELDLPIRIIDPLGGEKRYTYGPDGELLSETDEIGRATKYEYNENLDCVSITNPDGTKRRFFYAENSLPQILIDESEAEFKRVYDIRGNITATIDALTNRREYSYNQFGDLEKVVDPLGGVTKFKWNERGQISEFTTPLGARTIYDYDERSRLVSVSDPLGNTTSYAYDASDRLAWMERPDGTKHRYEYDPEGNLTSFLDANGAETRFRYVDHNKLGERIDALGYARRFVYDTEANLVEVRNERGEAYRFAHDALGRVKGQVGFDGLTWEYGYDPAGQLIARTDPAGRVTRLVRDLQGRVLERQRPDGSAIYFSYDRVGRLTEADAPGSELEFRYDALGRVICESQNGQVVENEYDAIGRRIKRHSPSGQVVEFTYDADSRLSHLQTPRGSMEFEYDKAGRIAKRRSPGELEESFYYDRCGRIVEQWLDKSRQTLFHRGYKYDSEGNLIELADSKKGTSRFAYDPVERLREVTQPERKVERFVYDRTGNLVRRGEREFRYGKPDRLTQTDDATLIYDEVGNLIEKRRAGSVIRYSYDTDGRLIAVESKEGGRVEFAYDAFGRRIAKNTKDGETGFLWDGDVLLAEERCERSNEYIFEPGSFAPSCRFDEGGFEAYHNDHLGTPRELTDEKGQVVWSARYDVYGRVDQLQADRAENQIRFQGQYEDTETGLCYNYFRYFDPEVGRYITPDPIGLAGGANLYLYTVNPVNSLDPLGLSEGSGSAPGAVTRPADSPFYSVEYEAKLTKGVDYPGHSDKYHFAQSNRQLHEAMKSDPAFAKGLESRYPGITEGVSPGPRGAYPRQSPHPDVTWHHHPTREGVTQLVPYEHHTSPGPVQESLHPNQRGGMENWGGGRRKPRAPTGGCG